MKPAIAIVGMACRYPDADTPTELWENVVAKRRAFRRMPDERLRQSDYISEDRNATDKAYPVQSAVLEGFEFDRQRFRVPGDTYRSADIAHWLALQVAAEALEDAGHPDARDLPRDATGVLLGNTLTGEFSRANVMRLRWPYVRRVVDAALAEREWSPEERRDFLQELEPQYKAPFPEVGGETLAGGLANTIAGRICNQFDLHGGGYTVDGACASSLLAVSQAASALTAGDLDVALAGGVDLSLDPFELVGFARLGALSPRDMVVYDERASGFWPGEGCGVVVLMREDDAVAQGKRIYATLRGWGVSSDGQGGLTRPEVEGQLMAVRRAYKRARYGADTVALFEGHGTGTAVGDPAEIQVLSTAILEGAGGCPQDAMAQDVPRPALGSIKANIGHTKAAAGTAGLIKAAMAVHHRLLPPTTACTQPTALLRDPAAPLRVLQQAEDWPEDRAVRAAVSAMGFGGINTHVTLSEAEEGTRPRAVRSQRVVQQAIGQSRSSQDIEFFAFRGTTLETVREQIDVVLAYAAQVSLSDMTDLSHTLAQRAHTGRVRAAVLASKPRQLQERLETLCRWIDAAASSEANSATAVRTDEEQHIFLANIDDASNPAATQQPRIGLLFPGQASPSYFTGGAWSTRFASIDALYRNVSFDTQADPRETAVAQPAICTAERAGMLALEACGIEASVAIGHSVGELAALQWAGVYDEAALLRLSQARGQCMSRYGERQGAMISVAADTERAAQLVQGTRVVVAGMNAPGQTILSGDARDMQDIVQRAAQQGITATELRVSHAFHSPHMQAARQPLRDMLQGERFADPQRRVLSTITGQPVQEAFGLTERLVQQLVDPVRFAEALQQAQPDVDVWIECGPGNVLSGLVRPQVEVPVVSLDAGSASLDGLLRAFATVWCHGGALEPVRLFEDRFTRPFDLAWQPSFLANPCESAPDDFASAQVVEAETPTTTTAVEPQAAPASAASDVDALDVVRQLVAAHLELPTETVKADSQLLTDLHLNSITISEIVGQAARTLGLQAPQAVTEFANASVGDIAAALDTLRTTGGAAPSAPRVPEGVDRWVRAFEVAWHKAPALPRVDVGASMPTISDSTPTDAVHGSRWSVLAAADHPFAERVRQAFPDGTGSGGVIVCMPQETAGCCADLLLQAAQQTLSHTGRPTFVVVQHTAMGGAPGAGFARTLHLENPKIPALVVDLPWNHEDAIDWLQREVAQTGGFREVRYAEDGTRSLPHLQVAERDNTPVTLSEDDVLLVTGGGKGIAAECALDLARRTGVRLCLLGRSHPEQDTELADNLERLQALGATVHYARADVTDAAAVQAAVQEATRTLGPVTAVLHGAGLNQPQLIAALEEPAFRRTFAPKVIGLRNVLQAVDAQALRVLVTFSSIIGRTGLAGEGDYALANEWASHITDMFAARAPHCRCLSLEWSVWSGSGMGERLGRIETLRQQGIADIPTDEGVAMLWDLLQRPPHNPTVVVAGRFGDPDTVRWNPRSLPLRRFIETPRVHIPDVELVVDATLSASTDPYLHDHVVQRQSLLPGVVGLEAMAQVAMALTGSDTLPTFEDVEFLRPIVVDPRGKRVVRLAALQNDDGSVRVVLRSDAHDFNVDHFRAVCRFESASSVVDPGASDAAGASTLALQPAHLYDGNLLFHRGRFQRLHTYHALQARACDVQLTREPEQDWFVSWMPPEMALGDAAARDAAIHAIQACIPHARLLPVGVRRLRSGSLSTGQAYRVRAHEVAHDGDEYTYDMHIEDADGQVIETWEGLRLRRMERIAHEGPWQPELFGPYAERRVHELAGGNGLRLALQRDVALDDPDTTAAVLQQAVGGPVSVWRRGDGKPESTTGEVSSTHSQGFTLAVQAHGTVACDLEVVEPRDASRWEQLLGTSHTGLARELAHATGCSFDAAATQVWSTLECLKKAGMSNQRPLVFENSEADGWNLLRAGSSIIATCITSLQDAAHPMALAVLTEGADARV